MTTEMIKIRGGFELTKHTYLPGLVLKEDCPICGRLVTHDYECNYLSFPIVGESVQIHFNCFECDHEWKGPEVVIHMFVEVKNKYNHTVVESK